LTAASTRVERRIGVHPVAKSSGSSDGDGGGAPFNIVTGTRTRPILAVGV
jgi:hypothetical protein